MNNVGGIKWTEDESLWIFVMKIEYNLENYVKYLEEIPDFDGQPFNTFLANFFDFADVNIQYFVKFSKFIGQTFKLRK